jgi:hypothetical protein
VAVASLAIVSTLLGSGLVACFDLLHGTGDLKTACEIDASAPGCASASVAAAVCATSGANARLSAEHACAWLGACETPMGRNAIGACMFSALLAFDCEANPNHPPSSAQSALWQCLAAAKTCGDVDRCVFPAEVPECEVPGDYTSCGSTGSASGPNDYAVRVECVDGGATPYPKAHGENCALWGLTCSEGSPGAACTPSRTPGCTTDECVGSTIEWCAGGANVGIDCSSWGMPKCAGFPVESSPRWVACLPESDAGATCAPDVDAGCAGGVAHSCPAGVPESVDCAALLGSTPDASSCQPGSLDPPFDWTSRCTVDPPACTTDACDGGIATGCARGALFPVNCSEVGLGGCSMRTTDLGTQQHAACTPPSSP